MFQWPDSYLHLCPNPDDARLRFAFDSKWLPGANVSTDDFMGQFDWNILQVKLEYLNSHFSSFHLAPFTFGRRLSDPKRRPSAINQSRICSTSSSEYRRSP